MTIQVGDVVVWRGYKREFRVIRLLKETPHAEVMLCDAPEHKVIKRLDELTKVR